MCQNVENPGSPTQESRGLFLTPIPPPPQPPSSTQEPHNPPPAQAVHGKQGNISSRRSPEPHPHGRQKAALFHCSAVFSDKYVRTYSSFL